MNQAIATFAADIKNSTDMGSRRDAVMFLAGKIGRTKANEVAEFFGLRDGFYKSYSL